MTQPATTPQFDWDNIERRIAAKRTRNASGCLVFTGARNQDGYGLLNIDNQHRTVHRLTYQLAHGPIPDGLVVMHTCDNPPCCNIDHLRLGTVADNNRDRQAKGRTVIPPKGGGHQAAKTHCKYGHPFSGDNLRCRPNGTRRCAACYRTRSAARRADSKAVAA